MQKTLSLDKTDSLLSRLTETVKLQEAELFRLNNIIETLPGSIYWKDKNGVYLGRNLSAARTMYKMSLEKKIDPLGSLGKTDYDFQPQEIADQYRANDLTVMETGQELCREEIVILPTGEKITQLSHKKPLRDELGNTVGVIGNTVDITYLKQIEKELEEAKSTAELANKVKTEFIRNMEHDIRTPFNGIWGIANYLLQHEQEPAKKQLLADITYSAKELLDYCNSILDFSKLELRTLPILAETFELKTILNSIMLAETPAAKYKNLAFTLSYAQDIPKFLLGDPYRLYRILINLVSNSIKFTEKGSVSITVNLAKKISPNIAIINITIQDTGIGISESKKNYLYEKSPSLFLNDKMQHKGIGLGFMIVKQFINELQGEIEIQSAIGKGSAFICTLAFRCSPKF